MQKNASYFWITSILSNCYKIASFYLPTAKNKIYAENFEVLQLAVFVSVNSHKLYNDIYL